jgi:hypothetical protein
LFDTGNIIGVAVAGCNTNRNVNLSLNGDVLTFDGERCPFQYDGFYEIVLHILGTRNPETVHPAAYETSVKEMRWYETKVSYEDREVAKLSDDQLAARAKKSIEKQYEDAPAYYEIRRRISSKAFPIAGTPEYKRAAASGTLATPTDYLLNKLAQQFY